MENKYPVIGLGGGCHWCTEAVFQSLKGVVEVQQGFICSKPPSESYSEAVLVTYDPQLIPLEILLEVHLRTHASTSDHTMRGKYRSAAYVMDEEQTADVTEIFEGLQADFSGQLVTQVLPFEHFKPSDKRFQNYYRQNGQKPFCRTYIDPKLSLLRQEFGGNLAETVT